MIPLPTKVYNQIRQIQNSQMPSDMRNVAYILFICRTTKMTEAEAWINANPLAYMQGTVEGFEVDNTQKSQLEEIHRNN